MHNRKIQKCVALECIPEILNSDSLNDLILLLNQLHVCCGQPDSHYISMVNAKKERAFHLMVKWLPLLITMLLLL